MTLKEARKLKTDQKVWTVLSKLYTVGFQVVCGVVHKPTYRYYNRYYTQITITDSSYYYDKNTFSIEYSNIFATEKEAKKVSKDRNVKYLKGYIFSLNATIDAWQKSIAKTKRQIAAYKGMLRKEEQS